MSVSVRQSPTVVEVVVQNATGGVYSLQSSYYKRNQIQFETTRPIAWNEDPTDALAQLPSIQQLSVSKVDFADVQVNAPSKLLKE